MTRCSWATNDVLIRYHDEEWGVPLHEDQRLFEFLILEGMQAGLSWHTILKKRPALRRAFDDFQAHKIAAYPPRKVQQLLNDPCIIRNRLKILSSIQNAKAYLKVKNEFQSFDEYIWRFVEGKPLNNRWPQHQQIPCQTPESSAMSKDLKRRGFSFVGSTICYAFMQATGMVNDHTIDCFRHGQIPS
ncbi:MAG: DNA-3-methyladenine glycosylase I [Nitrospirales bacterium]|nr:DNA-3-methyladenine glycosylase I [Nitrospira sp.]MDR4500317.1 DNA-3-methyladenine glycosylase I [Nitrospirales bacterium]